jgi:hypothetical protein
MVNVAVSGSVTGSSPVAGSLGSTVGSSNVAGVDVASPGGEASTLGGGVGVEVGSGVQVGNGVAVATDGVGCKATMIRLRIMLTAIKPLKIKMMVWLKLCLRRLRLRLLTRLYLLEKAVQLGSAAGR